MIELIGTWLGVGLLITMHTHPDRLNPKTGTEWVETAAIIAYAPIRFFLKMLN